MKYTQIKLISILSLLSLCANCGRITDWARCNFYQGIDLEIPYERICSYRRSVNIYDQLSTRAYFDVLFLSDEVRNIYSLLYARRHNYSDIRRNTLLQRQLQENKQYLTFYVLSLKQVILGSPHSDWSIVLSMDGKIYNPDEIKKVVLLPEYSRFFKDGYSDFVSAYQIRFYKKNLDGTNRIPHVSQMTLYFNTHDKTTHMTWKIDDENNSNWC